MAGVRMGESGMQISHLFLEKKQKINYPKLVLYKVPSPPLPSTSDGIIALVVLSFCLLKKKKQKSSCFLEPEEGDGRISPGFPHCMP